MAPHIIILNKPRWRNKIAAFDYDWTLVKPMNGRTHAKDVDDRQWLRASVPETLKFYYENGFALMVFTNQTKVWKLDAIEAQLAELKLPMIIAIGIAEADRKPHTTMWDAIIQSREWDKKKSFFVGDAAGRPGDWSDSDAVFAKAVGIPFKTPEETFAFEERPAPAEPLILERQEKEAIVMVGYPGSGKSTLAKSAFPHYVIIDGDKLKTAATMCKAASAAITKAASAAQPASIIFDATNGDVKRRASYIAWAKSNNIPIRAVWLDKTIDAAMEAATEREAKGGPHIPRIAFYTFRKRFEEPTTSEGFESVLHM